MKHLFTFLMLTATLLSQAQTQKTRIIGKVIDGNQKTIEAATIALLKFKDSTAVKFSAADKNGEFVFENIPNGKYLVSISTIGHEKSYSETFDVSDASATVELKTIELVPQAKGMANVTITAKKPLIEQKIDRTIVNVEASITNAGSTALEVLEKSPGITVDKDGNISLKGKEGLMVLIDGRPTYLSGPDLANFLRSMQASQLDQLEIMTNPPAKYDAAGNAGIINIKTKKNKQFGYNGSATIGYGQWYYPKFNESFNFNYRKNKVNLFTNLGHNYGENVGKMDIERNFVDRNTKVLLSSFNQHTRRYSSSNTYNGKIGADYFAGKNTTLGIVLTGYTSNQNRSMNTTTDIDFQNGDLSRQSGVSTEKQEWKNYSTNLNFRQVLDTTGSELTADVDFVGYDSHNATALKNYYFDKTGNTTQTPDTLVGALPQNIKIYSGKIDYLRPLKKGARFEAGIKSSLVKTDNNARYGCKRR